MSSAGNDRTRMNSAQVKSRKLETLNSWCSLAAALVLLNASLTFGNVWPTPKIRWESALSVELAVFVLLLIITHRRKWQPAPGLLACFWLLLIMGHYVDVTAPGLYGRDFNLYWDSRHLSNVVAMLVRDVPGWTIGLAVFATLVAIGAAYFLTRTALRSLANAVGMRGPRRALNLLAGTVVFLFTAQQVFKDIPFSVPFSAPVMAAYASQARYITGMAVANSPAPGPSPDLDSDLGRLDGADVLLTFVESYGAVTYETPMLSEGLGASRGELEKAVRDAGRYVVSAYVESPTFGGSSWLAHLSLLSGVEVRDEYAYASLMAGQRETLVSTFARRGYRTVAIMPGIRQEWPEGAFYRFDAIYNHDLMEYEGPKFGWWSIPDQYTLAKFDAMELNQAARAPVFAVFPTSTTHAPFGPVAPYQPDWSRLLTTEPYDAAETERALANTPSLTNLAPSYLQAMSYEYRLLAGYVRKHAGDNQLMVVIGDHQPPAAVSGRGASWDVPVHVITGSTEIMNLLLAHGFKPGMEPRRPAISDLHGLVPVLLNAFGKTVPESETQ